MDYGLQYKVEKQEVYYQADQLQTTYYHANVESQPQPTYSQAEAIPQSTSKIKKVSGYILFASKKRHEFKQKHPNASFVELTRIMSQNWKEMDESEKTPWRNEAIRLNKVHRDENPRSSKPPGVKNTTGNKPLTSGFLVFASYNRKAMHASNPGMGFGEISRILGERWRQMDAEEKQKWAETRLANAEVKSEIEQKSLITHAFENAVKGEPLEIGGGRGQNKKNRTQGDKPLSSGFLVFASYNRKQMHQNHPGMSFGEISKILGERWRQLTPEEKQKWAETPLPDAQNTTVNGVMSQDTSYGASDSKPLVIDEFHEMTYPSSSNAAVATTAQQSTSYNYQNQTFPQAQQQKSSRSGKVKTKGRKGVVTGFVLFGAENRKILRAAHPDKPFGKLSIMLSEAWKNLKDNERAMWRAQALEANKAAKLMNMQAAKQQQHHHQHHDQHQSVTVATHQQVIQQQHHPQQQQQQQQQQEVTKIDFTDIVENPNGNVIYDCCWNQCNAQFKYKADFLLHTIEKCVKNGPRATYTVKGAYRYNCLWRGCKNSMGYANFEKVIQHVRYDHIVRNEGHTLLEMKQEAMDHQASTVDTTQINMNTPVITISGDQFPGTSQYTVNQQQQIVGDQWAYAGTYNGQPITYVVLQPSNQMPQMTQTVLQLSNNVLQPVQSAQNVETHQVVQHDQYGNEVPSVTNRPFTIKKVGEPGGPTSVQQQTQVVVAAGGNVGGHQQHQQQQQQQQQQHQQQHQIQTPMKKEKNPKRMGNTTGFILFQGQKRKELVEKQAQSKDKYNFGQISKMLGEMWEKLPEDERAMWKAKAQEQNRQKRAALAAGGVPGSPPGQPLKTSTPIVNASTSKNQNFELAPSSSDHVDESNQPQQTATGMIQDEGANTDANKHFFDVQSEIQKTLKIWLYAFTTYITSNGVNFVEILTSLQFDVDPEENIDLKNFFANLGARLQRGDYKRLDALQADVFAFFERIRQLMEPTGPLLKALFDAQMCFIRTRNKLCANGKRIMTPALSHGPQHLETLIKNNKNGIYGATEFFRFNPRHDAILLRSSYFLYVKDDSVPHGTAIVKFDSFYGEDNSMFTGLYFTICTDNERRFLQCDVRNAVICQQVDQKAYSCAAIMGRCVILNEQDHVTRRPTEIPEKDVYICIARKVAEDRYEVSKQHPFLDGLLDYDIDTMEPDKLENLLYPEVSTLNYQPQIEATDTASYKAINEVCDQITLAGRTKNKGVVIDDDLKHLMEADEESLRKTVNNNDIDEVTVKRICQGLQANAFDLYKECNKRIFGNTLETEWDKLEAKDKLYWEATASKLNYAKLVRQYPQSAVCQITRASELQTFSLFACMQGGYVPDIYFEASTLVKVWQGLKQKEKEYYQIDLDQLESRQLERMMGISILSNTDPQNTDPAVHLQQLAQNFQNTATGIPVLCGVYECRWNHDVQQFEGHSDFLAYAQRLIFTGKQNGIAYQCLWDECPDAAAGKHFGLEDLKNHVNNEHLKDPPYKIIHLTERTRHFNPLKVNQDYHQQQYMEH